MLVTIRGTLFAQQDSRWVSIELCCTTSSEAAQTCADKQARTNMIAPCEMEMVVSNGTNEMPGGVVRPQAMELLDFAKRTHAVPEEVRPLKRYALRWHMALGAALAAGLAAARLPASTLF